MICYSLLLYTLLIGVTESNEDSIIYSEVTFPKEYARKFEAITSPRTTATMSNKKYNFTLIGTNGTACSNPSKNYHNKWVAIQSSGLCFRDDQFRNLQAQNISGIIYFSGDFGLPFYVAPYGSAGWADYSYMTAPIFLIRMDQKLFDYIEEGNSIEGVIEESPNVWMRDYSWFNPLMQVINLPWNLINIVLCIKGLKEYFEIGNIESFWIPISCLVLQFLEAILKIMFCLDPFGKLNIAPNTVLSKYLTVAIMIFLLTFTFTKKKKKATYNIAPLLWITTLYSLGGPFSSMSTILINLYWLEIMIRTQEGKSMSVGLKKLKTPFIIIACILGFLTLFQIFLYTQPVPTNIAAICNTIVNISLIILISFTGVKLRRVFGTDWNKDENYALRKVSSLIVASAGFSAITFISVICAVISYGPLMWGFSLIGIVSSESGVATFQILAFHRKYGIEGSSVTSRSDTSTNEGVELSEQSDSTDD